jgi:hypothetical protein
MGESIVPAYPAALAAPERDGRAGTANGTGGMPAVVNPDAANVGRAAREIDPSIGCVSEQTRRHSGPQPAGPMTS